MNNNSKREFGIFGKRQIGFEPSSGYGGILIVDGGSVADNWYFRWYASADAYGPDYDPFDFDEFNYGMSEQED